MSDVTVSIVSVVERPDAPGVEIGYQVRNAGSRPVWLVDDGWIVWRQEGRHIEISLARTRMQPGAQVFGYFDPKVREIGRGGSVSGKLSLTWPLRLDRLWNDRSEADPEPGEYQLVLRVGYGLTPAPGELRAGEGVEDPVFRWQHEAVSEPVTIHVRKAVQP